MECLYQMMGADWLKNILKRGSAAAIRRADDDICPRFEL
jgi:hypothetical protein